MKKTIAIIAIIFFVHFGFSQEYNLPIHSQYMGDNPFLISPAFAGIGDNIQIRLNGLSQWVGVKDAPDTQAIAIDGRISNKSGAGILLFNDKNGNTTQFGGQFSFAHHLTLNQDPDQYLSFGISYKFTQFKIDLSNQGGFGIDPVAEDGDFKDTNSNFDISLLYRHDSFYISLNSANILSKKLKTITENEPTKLRAYYLYSGYIFRKGRYDVEFEPSVLIQYFESDGRSTTDINFKYRKIKNIEDYLWAGVSFRFINDEFFDPLAVIPMVGLKKKNFYVAYGFQINFNEIQSYSRGTHMITLGYDLFQGASNCKCTASPNLRD